MSSAPKLRSLYDRIRQVALFETIGLIVIAPAFALLSGQPFATSLGLLAMLSLIAALWNGAYGTAFDWAEGRLTGRTADCRPAWWRIVHAIGFESGLMLITLPVIIWWTHLDWWTSLLSDIGLAVTYMVYAYFFNLAYDRTYPIADPLRGDLS